MNNNSKISFEKHFIRQDSGKIIFPKYNEMNKTVIFKSQNNINYPSLEYKKRPNNFSKTSFPKITNDDIDDSRSPYPEFKLEGNRIPNAKMLNNEFKKKMHEKTIRKIEEAQQTSFDNRQNTQKNNLTNNIYKVNTNCHNQVINFDTNPFKEENLKDHLIILRRYSIYTFDIIQSMIKKRHKITNNSVLLQNEDKSKHKFYSLEKQNYVKNNHKFMKFQNMKNEFHEAIESTAKAVMDAVNERRKTNIQQIKTYTFKEKGINQFFDHLLERVYRKVNYISEKNNPLCQDYVVNLIQNEVISITENIEGLIKSPAFIKHFTQKNDMDSINSSIFPLPYFDQLNNSKINTKNNFNTNKHPIKNNNPNTIDLPSTTTNKVSINFRQFAKDLISIKEEENIQEENIDLSETLCQKINSKTKRNWSFRELHEKELPIKTSFSLVNINKTNENLDLKRDLSENLSNLKKINKIKNDNKNVDLVKKISTSKVVS